ncbi:MAG: hypothetical protein OXF33_03120 [Rhodospirillales bacterium]|nr:hypothetical protein [Rhodospirillales bacterium]
MSNLGRAAAIATIVGAIFTAATFFYISDETVETGVPSASTGRSEGQTGPNVHEENEPKANAITESSHDVDEAEIRTRLDAARKIPGMSSRSRALQRLAKKASDFGFLSTAFLIASEIPGMSTRSATLSYVAKKAAKMGDLELAIRIAETIPGMSTRSQTLSEISEL